ncbi:hypothetical protein [Bradyrhizobium stylosanthis]|uniref:hypothetical protein n=1 Tax=Bradyrhizobium stylosanthis TaxID=1803665 RepID=UPI000B1998A4|nr:hypothetical protein [Bradyrhizobium stylosanthis]
MPTTSEAIAPKTGYMFRAAPRTLGPQILDLSEDWAAKIDDDWSLDTIELDTSWQQSRTGLEATTEASADLNLEVRSKAFGSLGDAVRLMKRWTTSNPSCTSSILLSPLFSALRVSGMSGSTGLTGVTQSGAGLYPLHIGARLNREHFKLAPLSEDREALVRIEDHWRAFAQAWRSLADAALQASGPTFAAALELRLAEIPNIPAAPDSVLPDRDVINAARQIASYLPVLARLPEIEIDDSVGSISLIWRDDRRENSYSLEIPNARYVVGIGIGKRFSNARPWRHRISDERRITAEIQSSAAAQDLMKSS